MDSMSEPKITAKPGFELELFILEPCIVLCHYFSTIALFVTLSLRQILMHSFNLGCIIALHL